jgi:hypothetical protein
MVNFNQVFESLDEFVNENHASKLIGAQTLGKPIDSY